MESNIDRPLEIARDLLLRILIDADFGDKLIPYGSRVVCEPPVLDTDIDFFFRVPSGRLKELELALFSVGFATADDIRGPTDSRPSFGEANPDERFSSYRLGKINLVVTESEEFAKRHRAATRLCKRLNLLDKKDRVAVYQAVLYGKAPE